MKLRNLLTIACLMLKRVWNDKFFLYVIVISPVVVCINYGYVVYENPTNINTYLVIDAFEGHFEDNEIQLIAEHIENHRREDGTKPFKVRTMLSSPGTSIRLVDEGKKKAAIWLKKDDNGKDELLVIVDVTEPALVTQYEQEVPIIIENYSNIISSQLLNKLLSEPADNPINAIEFASENILTPYQVTIETNAWKDLVFFDYFASAVIVLVALAMPLFLSSISITYDQSMNTLERIFASPYKKAEIIIGKMLANSILALVITILIIVTLRAFFNITLGSLALILGLSMLVAVNGVIFGLLISSITRKVAQSLITAMLSLLFFMSIMTYLWPREAMHFSMKFLSQLIPYSYGLQAVRQVNMTGAGFAETWFNVVILTLFIIIQALLAISLLRRQIV